MEELEPYSKQLRMTRLQKLQMSRNDLKLEPLWVQAAYYSVTSMAVLAVAAAVALGVYDSTREPTLRERMDDTADAFEFCVDEHTSAQQKADLDLDFAFPEYQLDTEIQAIVDQCRTENPMPQPSD